MKRQKMMFLTFRTKKWQNVERRWPFGLESLSARYRLQTFARPLLFYCWLLHVVKMPLMLFLTFFLLTFCDSTFFYCIKKCKTLKTTFFRHLFWRFYIQCFVSFFLAFFDILQFGVLLFSP